MKVLLTGSSGFIGQNILKELNTGNYFKEIYASYLLNKPALDSEKIKPLQLDLTSNDEVSRNLSSIKPDIVIHAAWFVDHANYKTSLKNFDWIETTYNLAQNFIKNNGTKFIFLGTCFENINQFDCIYSKSKKTTSFLLKKLFENSQSTLNIVRPSFVYGLGEPKTKLISANIIKMLKHELVECLIPNSNLNFIEVHDLAKSIAKISTSSQKGDFNIGSQSNLSIKDLFIYLSKKTNHPVEQISFSQNDKFDMYFQSDLKDLQIPESDIFKMIDDMIKFFSYTFK